MFFTVIIPVYNVEQYLSKCIESVLNQEESDLEILLVDDGSTDKSGDICDEYFARYPKVIRVIHKHNEGLLLTRRRGIQAAKGQWFVHLDSDDYMLPESLRAIRTAIETYKADLVICKIAYGAKDGKSIDYYSKLPFDDKQIFEGENKKLLYRQLLAGGYMTAIYQKIARRDIVDVETDYSHWERVSLAEDALQSFPILQNCTKAVFWDFPIIYYRYNAGSITKQKGIFDYQNNIRSLLDVYQTESEYYNKWHFTQTEISKIAGKHCRTLCVHIKTMMQTAKTEHFSVVRSFFDEMNNNKTWKTLFQTSDSQSLGQFSRLCYLLIKRRNIRMLRYLCKWF